MNAALDQGDGRTGIEAVKGIFTTRQRYGFENVGFELSGQDREEVAQDQDNKFFNTFISNLDLGDPPPSVPATRLLKRFVAVNHVGAKWYSDQLKIEIDKQNRFFWTSVVLLVAIPLIILVLPKTLSDEMSPSAIGAQVTAFLTGLIGLHRSISQWLSQRKLIEPYWRARSDLLDIIYTTETDWGGRDRSKKTYVDSAEATAAGKVVGDLKPEILEALMKGVEDGRKIVRTQMDAYFKNYSLPTIDLVKELKQNAADAGKLYELFRPPEIVAAEARAAAAAKKEAEIDGLEGDLAGIRAVLAELDKEENELNTRKSKSGITKEEEAQIVSDLKAVQAEQRKLKAEERVKIRTLAAKKNG